MVKRMIRLCKTCLVILAECACPAGPIAKATALLRGDERGTVVLTDGDQRFLRSIRIRYGVCRHDYLNAPHNT